MKRFSLTTLNILIVVVLCSGLLISCSDDDDSKTFTTPNVPVGTGDPSLGFMANSTQFYLRIDFSEKEIFDVTINPGQIISMNLQENKTYVIHVAVLNNQGTVLSEYVNSFFIDNIPLDNQLRDFICSWYVDFRPNNPGQGFSNAFGS